MVLYGTMVWSICGDVGDWHHGAGPQFKNRSVNVRAWRRACSYSD